MISFPSQQISHFVDMASKYKTLAMIGPCGSGKRMFIKQALDSARELPLEQTVIIV